MSTTVKEKTDLKYSNVDWFGEIPIDWRVEKIKSHFNLSKERASSDDNDILSLTQKGIKVRDISGNEGQMAASYDNYAKLRKGDIVLNPMDLISGYVDLANQEGIISPAYTILRKKKTDLNLEYAKHFFQWHYIFNIFFPFGKGVSVDHRWTLSDDVLLNFPILIPPIETQKKIAIFLDKKTKEIDEIINKKKKLIRFYDELRISIISKTVTRSIQSNIRLKKTGLIWPDAIPNNWKICRLRFLAVLNPSKSEVSKIKDKMVSFLPMPLVSEDGRIDLSEEKNINSVFSGYTYFADNDVIVAKITPCFENGKGAVLRGLTNGIAFGSTEFHVMRTEKLDCDYLYYITMSHAFRKIGELEMRGSAGQQRVPVNFVKDFYCAYPDIKEQKKIVVSLNKKIGNIDKTIEKTRAHMRKLKEYRASLIYNAVTGKIKI